jgi:hypothetical protein
MRRVIQREPRLPPERKDCENTSETADGRRQVTRPEHGNMHAPAVASDLHALLSARAYEMHAIIIGNLVVTEQLEQSVL